MNLVKTLLENKNVLKNAGYLSIEGGEIIAAFDEDGNMIAVGEAWTYISETGIMMSEYLVDGSPREAICGEKQKIEMLYLIPGDLKPEENARISEAENNAFPLPPAYSVGQIVCEDHVFIISSKEANPPVCGAYDVIEQQLSSAARSYYTGGLASNVLERYYYEFLPESHQLYLDEEMFKREIKARKKHTTDLKKITEENFQKDTSGKCICEQKIKLWGVTTTLYTDYKENSENKEYTLKEYINQLNTHILWIEKHRKEIEKELLKSNMAEMAKAWMEDRQVLGEDGQTYYELDDGELFPYPITENSFLEKLFIQSMHIYGDTSVDTRIQLFLNTVPNFFADHSIEIFIHVDVDIRKPARTNRKYRIYVGGLAG